MDILVIDGVALPTPNEYKVQLSDLDSSGTCLLYTSPSPRDA